MVSKAIARFARISPRKARVVVNLVRGRQAGEALQLLEFTQKSGAPVVKKIVFAGPSIGASALSFSASAM
jgi:large subunit ribosomal protein L22